MNWMVVVLFATMMGDFYVFTTPTFDTREKCMEALNDPLQRLMIARKLNEEYGRPMPIRLANCLEEQELKKILQSIKERKQDT